MTSRVKVYARLRPFLSTDSVDESGIGSSCVRLSQKDTGLVKLIDECDDTDKQALLAKVFHLDHVFSPSSSQLDVYNTFLKPTVEDFLAGYNGTAMAYGHTTSGKTYTMFGDHGRIGLAQHALTEIMENVHNYGKENDLVARVYISFYQIYLEQVYDLFEHLTDFEKVKCDSNDLSKSFSQKHDHLSYSGKSNRNNKTISSPFKSLPVKEDIRRGGFYVEGLRTVFIEDAMDGCALIQHALKQQQISRTAFNIRSSRSHAVFQIHLYLESDHASDQVSGQLSSNSFHGVDFAIAKAKGKIVTQTCNITHSTLTIVDLAGSEKLSALNDVDRITMAETKFINKSISALGKCFLAKPGINNSPESTSKNTNKKPFVVSRESQITKLLGKYLMGNGNVCIVANISPCSRDYQETLATLKFACRARRVENAITLAEKHVFTATAHLSSPHTPTGSAQFQSGNIYVNDDENDPDLEMSQYFGAVTNSCISLSELTLSHENTTKPRDFSDDQIKIEVSELNKPVGDILCETPVTLEWYPSEKSILTVKEFISG